LHRSFLNAPRVAAFFFEETAKPVDELRNFFATVPSATAHPVGQKVADQSKDHVFGH